jgi:hypothetical protein
VGALLAGIFCLSSRFACVFAMVQLTAVVWLAANCCFRQSSSSQAYMPSRFRKFHQCVALAACIFHYYTSICVFILCAPPFSDSVPKPKIVGLPLPFIFLCPKFSVKPPSFWPSANAKQFNPAGGGGLEKSRGQDLAGSVKREREWRKGEMEVVKYCCACIIIVLAWMVFFVHRRRRW